MVNNFVIAGVYNHKICILMLSHVFFTATSCGVCGSRLVDGLFVIVNTICINN